MKRGMLIALLLSLVGVGGIWSAHAATFTSPSFSINGNIGDSAAGAQSSTSYRLTSAAGESVAGQSSSNSYKLGQGYVATLENSVQLVTQPSGLIAYYPLNQTSGTNIYDGSANTNDGSAVGTPGYAAGKVGEGMDFNGTTDYVNAGTYSIAGSAITASAWIYGSPLSGESRIVSKANGQQEADHNWLLGLGAGAGAEDRLRVRLKTGGVASTFSTGDLALSDTTWYHVAFTYDGSNVRIYLNGAVVGTFAKTGVLDTSSSPVRIGSGDDGAGGVFSPWNGIIDEVKLFNRSLSTDDIKAEYAAGSGGVQAGLAIGPITPGVSQTASFDSIVQTSAGGYTLAINQNNNLTSGGFTIPAVSGSIASPVAWSEGTTKGLGFTLYGTNATSIPGSWGSGSAYAALPASATSFYTRTNYSGGSKDVISMRVRLDTQSTQVAGDYTNQMVVTGTMIP